MNLISAEILDGASLPTGCGVISPTAAVYAVLEGAVYINGNRLSNGEFYVVEENDVAFFEASDSVKCRLLRAALDFIDADVLPVGAVTAVADEHRLATFAASVEFCNVLIPTGEQAGAGIADFLASALVSEGNDDSCGSKYVDMAKRYRDANYFLDIRVEDLAEKIGVDRKYLRNLFTEYLGASTKDYIMSLRIERAKELLENSDTPVNSVALSVGYADALGFSKMFKKYTGLSPSEFRGRKVEPTSRRDVQKEPAQEAPVRVKEDIKYFLL